VPRSATAYRQAARATRADSTNNKLERDAQQAKNESTTRNQTQKGETSLRE
jgi:hypothetical protein